VVSIVWIAPAAFAVVERIAQQSLNGEPMPGWRDLVWTGGDWAVYAVLTPFIFWTSRRWPIERPIAGRRIAWHVGGAVVFCIGWATAGKTLEFALAWGADPTRSVLASALAGTRSWHDAALDWFGWVLVTLPFGCVVYFSIAAIAHALRYFSAASERELQVARMAEQLAGARLAALQAQVNPHFLFNTLNTIAVLVRDGDRDGAVRIVEQLSDVLRRTLSQRSAAEAPLVEELALVRQYLAIEQARFSDRLRVTWTVPPEAESGLVPTLAVQHLVENAIRHGLSRREDAGDIHISAMAGAETMIIRVEDDGPGPVEAAAWPEGRGLSNTRDRLAALYGDTASLTLRRGPDEHGAIAELRLPFRPFSSKASAHD
jgi:signal transduction histidine kinase